MTDYPTVSVPVRYHTWFRKRRKTRILTHIIERDSGRGYVTTACGETIAPHTHGAEVARSRSFSCMDCGRARGIVS